MSLVNLSNNFFNSTNLSPFSLNQTFDLDTKLTTKNFNVSLSTGYGLEPFWLSLPKKISESFTTLTEDFPENIDENKIWFENHQDFFSYFEETISKLKNKHLYDFELIELKKNYRILSLKTNEPEQLSIYRIKFENFVSKISKEYPVWMEKVLKARQLEEFLKTPAVPCDDKMFAHIHGDQFILDSQYEGNYQNAVTLFRLKSLKAKLGAVLTSSLCDNQSKITFCHEIVSPFSSPSTSLSEKIDMLQYQKLEKKLELALKLNSQLKTETGIFKEDLTREFHNLAAGDAIFFPAGWYKHAIAFQFIKEQSGLVTLRTYNTGSQMPAYHTSVTEGTKELYLPFVEVTDIPEESFFNLVNLKAIQDLSSYYPYNDRIADPELYETFLSQLGGKLSHHLYKYEDVREAQRSGTCSYMSQVALFSQLFDNRKEAERFEFEIKFKSLLDYFEENKSRFVSDNESQLLIENGAALFSAQLAKWVEKGIINEFELPFITEKLKEIDHHIKETEVKRKQLLAKNNAQFAIHRQLDTLSFSTPSNVPPEPLLVEEINTKFPGYQSIDPSSWQPNAETFVSDLKSYLKSFHELNQNQNYINNQFAIESLILKIPFEDEFWEKMPPSQALDTLQLFSEISKEFLWSFLQNAQVDNERLHELKPVEYLAQIKLLTIANKILRFHALQLNCPLQLYQNSFHKFLNRMLMSQIKDPEWNREFSLLQDYWMAWKIMMGSMQYLEDPFKFDDYRAGRMGHEESDKFKVTLQEQMYENYALSMIRGLVERNDTLRSLYPELAKQPEKFQTAYLYMDKARVPSEFQVSNLKENIGVLPPAFFYVRNLSFITDFFQSGSFSIWKKTGQEPIFQEGIKYSALEWKETETGKYEWLMQHSIFGLKHEMFNKRFPGDFILEEAPCQHPRDHKESGNMDFYFQNSQNLFENPYLQAMVASDERHVRGIHYINPEICPTLQLRERIAPNKIVITTPADLYKNIHEDIKQGRINEYEMRRLLFLSSVESLQLQETLGYFTRNAHLLSQPDYQRLFKLLMFEGDLLEREFNKHPEDAAAFANVLTNFCHKHYYDQLDENPQFAAFFLEVNQYFQEYFDSIYKRYPERFPAGYYPKFLNSREEYRALLTTAQVSDETKSIFYQDLARTYRKQQQFQPAEMIELLSSVVNSKLYYREKSLDKEVSIELRDILHHKRTEIQRHLTGPEANPILNSVYQSIPGNSEASQWKPNPNFPYFSKEDGSVTLDVLNGKLYSKNKKICFLPNTITSDSDFQTLFKNEKIIDGVSLNHNAFGFISKTGDYYQVVKNPNEKIVIQKEFKGKWFRYFPGESLDLEPRALADDYVSWFSNHPTKEILICQKETLAPVYRVEYKTKWMFWEEKIIHQLNEKGDDTDLVVMNVLANDSPLKVLERIEDPSYLVILQNIKTGEPRRIELPRFGLIFDVQSNDSSLTAISRQFSNYTIATNQGIATLEGFPNFLLLEKKSPTEQIQRMAILPFQNFKEEKNSFETKPVLDREIFDKKNVAAKQKILTYDLDPKTTKLIPKTDEARFFLAKVYLWNRQYGRAFEYLEGLGSHIKAYSKETMDELIKIVRLESLKKDNHPKAIALRLKAAAIILRHVSDFGFQLSDSFDLTIDYVGYLQTKEFSLPYKLSDEEEIEIILSLTKSNDRIQNRIFELTPKAYGRLNSLASTQVLPSTEISMRSFEEANERFQRELLPANTFVEKLLSPIPQGKTPSKPYELFEKPAKLLRSNLHVDFYEYYRSLRNPNLKTSDLQEIIFKIAGIQVPFDTEKKEQVDMITQALRLIQVSNNKIEKTAAIILEAIFLNPEKFPEIDEFPTFEKHQYPKIIEFFEKKIYAPIEELGLTCTRILNPEVTSNENTSLALPLDKKPIEESFQSCIQRKEFANLEAPLLKNPEKIIQKKEISEEQIQEQIKAKKELHSLFNLRPSDNIAQREFELLQQQLEKDSQSIDQTTFAIANQKRLETFQQKLSSAIRSSKRELKEMKWDIETLANKLHSHPTEKALQQGRLFGRLENPLTLEDVIFFYLKGEMQLLHQANSALSHEEIIKLNDQVQTFLITATYQQHLKKLATQTAAMQKAKGEDLNELVQEFAATLSSKREYQIADHPEYLVIEYFSKILLRKEQVENIDKLMIKNGKINSLENWGAVMEMIMGSGKTAVIAPLLSFMNADGKSLALCVMPESLVPSMSEDLVKTLGHSFRQKLQVISFDRSSSIDLKSLERLYERIARTRDEKHVLLMSNSSVMALYLKTVEKLQAYAASPSDALIRELNVLRNVFEIFNSSGIATLDEIHLILDVLKSFHFTIGMSKPLDLLTRSTISNLYLSLAQDSEINQKIQFSFMPNKATQPFTENFYHQEIKPIIIEKILKGEFFKSNDQFQQFITTLSEEQKKLLTIYLNDKQNSDAFKYVNDHVEPDNQDILALLKEEISVLLPLTCKKNLNEHYGQTEQKDLESNFLAVPYHDGQMTQNQFGTDSEIVNYTIQMHLERGLSKEVIHKELLRLYKLYHEEKNLPMKERQAYLQFVKLCNDSQSFSLFNLSEEDIDSITRIVNQNPKMQLELIERHILSQITVYETQLNAEAQLFGILFKHLQGMTGTLWNYETFPKQIKAIYPSNTTVKTLNILWRKSPQKLNIISHPERLKNTQDSITSILKRIYNQEGIPNGSLIDAGGLFKGLSNKKVAEAILSLECWKDTPIKGVVYYSENGDLMVASHLEEKILHQKLDKAPFKKEELVAFWDQQHTSGSNIILGHFMTATVTVNRHTTLFTLLQAIYRLRGLAKGQSANLAVSKEDHEIIKASLNEIMGKAIEGDLELKHILIYTLYEQTKRQGQNNHRAFKRKMEAILIDKIMQIFTDPTIKMEDVVTVFKETRGLFESTQNLRPFQLYGKLHKLAPSQEVIDKEVSDFLNTPAMQAFTSNPTLRSKFDPEKIKLEIEALAVKEIKNLPAFLTSNEQYGKERSVVTERQAENESQKEAEAEKESEKEINQKRSESSERIVPRERINWKENGLFEKSYFKPENLELLKEKKYNSELSPIIRMEDFMEWRNYLDFLDTNLLGTLNQFPVHHDSSNQRRDKTTILERQKFCSEVLIIQDKESNEIKLLLIDPEEADFFKKELINDGKDPKDEKRETKLALYHLENGMDVTGSERIDQTQLEKDPQFQKLKVQAKILKGYSTYNKEEVKILKRMYMQIDHLDPEKRYDRKLIDKMTDKCAGFNGSSKVDLDILIPAEYVKNNQLDQIADQAIKDLQEWHNLAFERELTFAEISGNKIGFKLSPSNQTYFENIKANELKIQEIEQQIDKLIYDF